MQFYDTPRNVREAIECPPPNPLGNYDYPTAGNDDHTLLKYDLDVTIYLYHSSKATLN